MPAGQCGGNNRVMEFQDKVLKCVDCGKDFVFTAGEQLFFHDKQFHNDPKRCKACKLKRGGGSSVRVSARTLEPPPRFSLHALQRFGSL